MRNIRIHHSIGLVLSLSLSLAGCANGERKPDPHNEVVVMLDGSISYKARRLEAINRAVALLDSMAQTKVRRWEQSADRIAIITVDAVPEVIWEGTIRELKALKQSDWTERLKSRTDYEGCTDVEAAFKLAAKRLGGDSQYVDKYLWAYTDLIHEPPATSIRRCEPAAKPSVPSDGFPWSDFQDVSVAVFWVPPEQKLAWKRAVTDQGLGSSFALYTTSESGEVKISPPPKPAVKITEGERAADRESYKQSLFTILTWFGIVVVAFAVLVGASLLIARTLGRRQSRVPNGPNRMRAVPPLPLATVTRAAPRGAPGKVRRPMPNR